MPNEKVLLENSSMLLSLKRNSPTLLPVSWLITRASLLPMIPNFVKNCVKLALSTVLLKTPCSVWH